MTEFLTLDQARDSSDVGPLLTAPFPPSPTFELLTAAQNALCDFMCVITTDWEDYRLSLADVRENMHAAADRLCEVAERYAELPDYEDDAEEADELDDDEDKLATAPEEAPPEPHQLDDEEPPEPAAQLAEDRLADMTLFVEAAYDQLVDPLHHARVSRNVIETLFFLLALADRLTGRAASIFGEGIELSERAYAVLIAVAERIEKGKLDARVDWPIEIASGEIGFGPWKPAG
jgi:hypothetical protein